MPHLILVRHGQSEWNLEKRFTGWVDVDLTGKGKLEACKSGEYIKKLELNIDYFFSSFQLRAINTLKLIQDNLRNNIIFGSKVTSSTDASIMAMIKKTNLTNFFNNLDNFFITLIKTFSSMPLTGAFQIAHFESFIDGQYEITVILMWSQKHEKRVYALLNGENISLEPSTTSLKDYIKNTN